MAIIKKVVKKPAAKAPAKVVAKAAPAAKGKVALIDLTGLTGLALHHAKQKNAKASGKPMPAKAKAAGAAKKTSGRVALPIFKAPADFKPHFLEVFVKTEKDGLLGSSIKATRYQGRYDPEAEDKKKADLGTYDSATLMGILSRFSGVTYGTNMTRRLPPNTVFRILTRVNKKSADSSLSVGIKAIAKAVKSTKTGRMLYKDLLKTDPDYRRLRKASRLLPAAFKTVLMPPKRVRGQKVEAEADDE